MKKIILFILASVFLYFFASIFIDYMMYDIIDLKRLGVKSLIFVVIFPPFLLLMNFLVIKAKKISYYHYKYDSTFESNLTSEMIMEKLKLFMPIKSIQKEHNRLIIKTGINIFSWGELITIEFKEADGIPKFLRVSSEPSFCCSIIDFGKNFDNVKKIESILGKN